MNKLDDKNYEKSNRLESVALSRFDKSYMARLLKSSSDAEVRRDNSQLLLDYLCTKFKIPKCRIEVTTSSRPQSKTNRGTATKYGFYRPGLNQIVIYNTTSVKKQDVAIKTFTETLLHEFIHHYDMTYLKFSASPHTAGFYKRISDLKSKLS